MSYNIRKANSDDAQNLAPIMRDLDREEVWASSGKNPLEALLEALWSSDEAYVALYNNTPFCMFGVTPQTKLGGIGSPWLLTSKDIVTHQKELLRWSRKVTNYWLAQKYSKLVNFIDARHKPGLRWAKWVGFQVAEPIKWGPFSMKFHPITMDRNNG